MTGGPVLQANHLPSKNRVWISCQDEAAGGTVDIYVQDTAAACCVERGDTVYWSGDVVYWTPKRAGVRSGVKNVCLNRHDLTVPAKQTVKTSAAPRRQSKKGL